MLSCCVCWSSESESADDDATTALRLGNISCGHVVCDACLPQLHTSSCPVCRSTFDRDAWRRIYSGGHGGGAAAADVAKGTITIDRALDALRGFLHDHPHVYDLPYLPHRQRNNLHDQLMERIQQIGTICPPTEHVRVVQLCGLPPCLADEMRTVLSDARSVSEARRGTAFAHLPIRVFHQLAPPSSAMDTKGW